MSLRDPTSKMSKSDKSELSRINLTDSPDEIRKKISKAVTDSIPGISYEPETRHGISNLIRIMSVLLHCTELDIVEQYSSLSSREFKRTCADVIVQHLQPIQTRIHEMLGDREYLMKRLDTGNSNARKIAEEHTLILKNKIGMY